MPDARGTAHIEGLRLQELGAQYLFPDMGFEEINGHSKRALSRIRRTGAKTMAEAFEHFDPAGIAERSLRSNALLKRLEPHTNPIL